MGKRDTKRRPRDPELPAHALACLPAPSLQKRHRPDFDERATAAESAGDCAIAVIAVVVIVAVIVQVVKLRAQVVHKPTPAPSEVSMPCVAQPIVVVVVVLTTLFHHDAKGGGPTYKKLFLVPFESLRIDERKLPAALPSPPSPLR